MKKLSIFLIIILILSALTSCGKKDTGPNWSDPDAFIDINDKDPSQYYEDFNLAGVLYDETNKPKDSVEIVIYDCAPHKLTIEPHKSYALPEKLNIQYLLDTISAYSAKGTISFTGYVIDDIATVNISSIYSFIRWLNIDYPEEYLLYNPPKEESQDAQFNAYAFEMNALEVIDKTLKENLNITKVIFKTNDDQDYLTLGDDCKIKNGIFFDKQGYPLYLASQYNYYGPIDFENLVNSRYATETNKFKDNPIETQLRIINDYLYTSTQIPDIPNTPNNPIEDMPDDIKKQLKDYLESLPEGSLDAETEEMLKNLLK